MNFSAHASIIKPFAYLTTPCGWVDEFGLSLGAWMIQGDPSFFLSLLPRFGEKIGSIAEAGGERRYSFNANDSENENDAKKRVLHISELRRARTPTGETGHLFGCSL